MNSTYNLYIGADNYTGKIDKDEIARIVSLNHEGFTMVEASGYWQGKAEPSVIVTICDEYVKILATARNLGIWLDQEAIGVQPAPSLTFLSDYR
jgi:hypothetical protein